MTKTQQAPESRLFVLNIERLKLRNRFSWPVKKRGMPVFHILICPLDSEHIACDRYDGSSHDNAYDPCHHRGGGCISNG